MRLPALPSAFLFLIALYGFTLSSPALAANCAEIDDLGETYCTCDDGATTYEVPGHDFDSDTCNSACFDHGDSSYTLEECDSPDPTNPGLSTVEQEDVSDPATSSATSSGTSTEDPTTQTTDKALITPTLNIKIPGFSGFSDPTKSGGGGAVITSNFLAEYINAVYTFLLPAGALIAVVMMMIGGLQYAMARGKPKYIDAAKTRITNAITGMVLLLAAYNIAYLIDPSITDLKSLSIVSVEPIITEFNDQDISVLTLPDPSGGTNGVPYFSQRGNTAIYGAKCSGSPTIASSGCGPTSAAMVLSYYGMSTDPTAVAASFEASGYRVCNAGTAYAAFSKASIVKNGGFISEDININQHSKIEQLLSEDKPIIIAVGPSRFTKHGHFIVLTGINSDGTFSINDPNSGYKFATKQEIYDAIKFATYLHKKE